jgi:hypothetical protein
MKEAVKTFQMAAMSPLNSLTFLLFAHVLPVGKTTNNKYIEKIENKFLRKSLEIYGCEDVRFSLSTRLVKLLNPISLSHCTILF